MQVKQILFIHFYEAVVKSNIYSLEGEFESFQREIVWENDNPHIWEVCLAIWRNYVHRVNCLQENSVPPISIL